MSSFTKVVAGALMAQADAFEFLPQFVGQPCTVNRRGQLPPGGCGTGTENAPEPALSCINPDNNKPFGWSYRSQRTGYCGNANDPYLGASCTGGMMGSCGNGEEDSTGYSCDNPNHPGRPAKKEKAGKCMRVEPTYWGNKCGDGRMGACGAGLAPEFTSTKNWFCLQPTGQKKGYCTIKCKTGTRNACTEGYSCQNTPGTRDMPIEGGPGVCVKDEPDPTPVEIDYWGRNCDRRADCHAKHQQNDGFICPQLLGYCTKSCTQGTENPCEPGFECRNDSRSSRVGQGGVCIKSGWGSGEDSNESVSD